MSKILKMYLVPQSNITVMFKSVVGRYRQIFMSKKREVCRILDSVSTNPIFVALLRVAEKYAPDIPRKCPLRKGRMDYNFTMDNIFTEDDLFWGNFYPPTGLYKMIIHSSTPKDPEALRVEWIIEIMTRKGEVAVADW